MTAVLVPTQFNIIYVRTDAKLNRPAAAAADKHGLASAALLARSAESPRGVAAEIIAEGEWSGWRQEPEARPNTLTAARDLTQLAARSFGGGGRPQAS